MGMQKAILRTTSLLRVLAFQRVQPLLALLHCM
jgi:hypothetical protein